MKQANEVKHTPTQAVCIETDKSLDYVRRAVNCHEELLDVAELALANLQARSETNKKWSAHDQNTFEKLELAIAKAEGK